MNKKAQRLNQIVEILRERNGASLKELAQILCVSEMTIRRDLEVLANSGIIRLINGVAVYIQHEDFFQNKEYDLESETILHSSAKERIGRAAAALLEPDDVILIDTGTTTQYLAHHLPDNMNLTVLCYNMNILFELEKHDCGLISAGGYYHKNTQMFQSQEGIALIERTCINKAFISTAGVSRKFDVTCIEPYERDTKRAAIKTALSKILLVDSSKFNKICPAKFAGLADFDMIITDHGLDSEWIDLIRGIEIELKIV